MKVNPLTTHISCDVPDEFVGTIQRYLANFKGVNNVSVQPNGVSRKKGDAPSKMNDSSKREVIIAAVQSSPKVSLAKIKQSLAHAGFATTGTGAVMKELVESKAIKRLGRGIYTSPKKEATAHAA